MEINKLSTYLTVFLTPSLPYLLTGTTEAFKAMGKSIGEATSNKAKVLWERLWSPYRTERTDGTDQTLKKFAEALSKDKNPINQASLAQFIAKHLENHSSLTKELNNLIADDKIVQSVLIDYRSEVDDIMQLLKLESGKQEIIIRESKTGKIVQKQ